MSDLIDFFIGIFKAIFRTVFCVLLISGIGTMLPDANWVPGVNVYSVMTVGLLGIPGIALLTAINLI